MLPTTFFYSSFFQTKGKLFDSDALRKLDGTIKKNTAFVKKLVSQGAVVVGIGLTKCSPFRYSYSVPSAL